MFGAWTKSTERGQLTVRRDDILKKLDGQRTELVTAGVKSLALFGSLARDEAIDSSDVDLLVEFARPTGLLGLIALKHALERALEVEKVDLLTPGGLHPALKHRILSEAIRVI
jgi:predicted nucleotidyltransferase